MQKNIFLLLLILSFFSCKKREINTITNLFSSSEILFHKNLDIQDDLDMILTPSALIFENNSLITHNNRSNLIFSLIDLETNKVRKSWGRKGQGPGEIIGILDFYKNYNNTGINAWDAMMQRLNFYSFENILINDIILPEDLFKDTKGIKGQSFREQFFPNVLQINESVFLAFGSNEKKRFTLIDIKNGEKIGVVDYPKQDVTDIPLIFKNQAYNGLIRYNKQQNRVAYISFESEMFEIFSLDNSDLILKYGNYTTIPKYTFQDKGMGPNISLEKFSNGYGCYIALSVTDDKIFILYQQYDKEYLDEKSEKYIEKFFSRSANKILVFDWDGKPLKLYELDCVVEGIEFDKNKNRLYAIKSEFDPEIIYFDLP